MTKQSEKVKTTKKKEELEAQIEELTEHWKRALADYQNLEKRFEKEKLDFIAFANEKLILKLLSVLDHLERVQSYLKDDGLELSLKEFRRVLVEEGLDEIEVLGKKFDPREMEAVALVEGDEEDKVVEVVLKGYKLKGKVIRPAKVKVSKLEKLKGGLYE